MTNSNISFKQIRKLLLWEFRKQFFTIRYPVIICLGFLFFILFLPQSACQYLDSHAGMLVNIINLAFAMSFIFASFDLVFRKLTIPYDSIEYQKERAGSIPIPVRLAIRLFVNMLLCGSTLLYLVCASYGMSKFADENHTYLSYKYSENGFFYTFFICYILVSLIFLTLFLRRYAVDQNKYYFFPFVFSILGGMLMSHVKNSMLNTFTNWPVYVIHVVFILITLLICVLLFWQCCRYEREL